MGGTRSRLLQIEDRRTSNGVMEQAQRSTFQTEDRCLGASYPDASPSRDAHGGTAASHQAFSDTASRGANKGCAIGRLNVAELHNIASFLEAKDAVNLSLTCRWLNSIIIEYAHKSSRTAEYSQLPAWQDNWLLRYVNSRTPHEYMCWYCMCPHDWQAWRRAMAKRESALAETLPAEESEGKTWLAKDEHVKIKESLATGNCVFRFQLVSKPEVPMPVRVPQSDCYLQLTRWNGFQKHEPHDLQLCSQVEAMLSPTRPWYFHESALLKRAKTYNSLEYGLSLGYASNSWSEDQWQYTTEPLFVTLKQCGLQVRTPQKFSILLLKVRCERSFDFEELDTLRLQLTVSVGEARIRPAHHDDPSQDETTMLRYTSCECGRDNLARRTRDVVTRHEMACGSKSMHTRRSPKFFPRMLNKNHLCLERYTCWWCSAQYLIQLCRLGAGEHVLSVERYIDLGPANIWHLGRTNGPFDTPLFPSDVERLRSYGYEWACSQTNEGRLKAIGHYRRNLKQLYFKQLKTNTEERRSKLVDGAQWPTILKRSFRTRAVLAKGIEWRKDREAEHRRLEIKLGKRPTKQNSDADNDAASFWTTDSIPSDTPVSPRTYITPRRKWPDDVDKFEAGPSGCRTPPDASKLPRPRLNLAVPWTETGECEDSAIHGVANDLKRQSVIGTSPCEPRGPSRDSSTSSGLMMATVYTNTNATTTTTTSIPVSATALRKDSYSSIF
jgi:hypothetical protein